MNDSIDKEINIIDENNVDYLLDYITSHEVYICIIDREGKYKNMNIHDIPKPSHQTVEARHFEDGGDGLVVYKEAEYVADIYDDDHGKTAMPYSLKELICSFHDNDTGIDFHYSLFDSIFIPREMLEKRFEAINNN